MADQSQPPEELSEEELRAAYEQQLKQVRVEDVVVQTIVSLLNLGGRKAGLAPGTEDERDPDQLRQAIEATRVLLPLVEELLGADAKQLRDVLSQLQMAYAQSVPAGGPPASAGEDPVEGDKPEGPGPAQSSGRLWVPGQ
jgi:hypothetical protein